MVKRRPGRLRSIARKWAAGRLAPPWLESLWEYLLGWLGLAVLTGDAVKRWFRAVNAHAVSRASAVAVVWAARRGRMSARWAHRLTHARHAWTRRRTNLATKAIAAAAMGEAAAQPVVGRAGVAPSKPAGRAPVVGRAEEDAAGHGKVKRGKARPGAGKKRRRERRVTAERGAADRNALSWGKAKAGKVTVPPLKAYRRGLARWMTARRPAGGWRVAAGWATVVCAAAGLGILLAALTSQPPRPPQPAPQAMPSPAQGSGVALSRSLPTRIEIPAIGVDAGLLSLGVDANDELMVPPLDRAGLAGWYNLGPSPGEGGSAVIVGHVDSAKIGPAVFFNLGRLKPGDVITVTREDGTRPSFRVDSVQTFLKTRFPTRLVYEGERATLRVITCGGEFDKKSRSYLSNVVVFANLET